ncbi:MAG: diguanylate cyclase [Candidatus Eisenbacteria bacterium]|nr:diguanylate cyclase [Candidatus Eisenbacteria bacterium]
MKSRFPIQSKLFLSHFLAVVLVSGSVGTYFYMSAVRSLLHNLQQRLQNTAALMSQVLDADQIRAIRTDADATRPEYLETLRLLRDLKQTNHDIAFLYIMRLENERVYFVVDSDETDRQAPPGLEYAEAGKEFSPWLRAGFNAASVDRRIVSDEWGSFMSGYAPIRNGLGEYLVGVDMRADEVQAKLQQIRASGLVSLSCSLILAFLFSRLLSSHFIRPISMLVSRCHAIAEGKLDGRVESHTSDELDILTQAFNTMSDRLSESREESRKASQALKRAKDELEDRVADRTRDLSDANENLLHEIQERKRAEEALALSARTDHLTGVLNRRAIVEHLQYQLVRTERDAQAFAVIVGDLDFFKRVNDSYGHLAGDAVLKASAERLRAGVRRQDLVARWGGDEFLLLLPDTDVEGAQVLAEKLRERITNESYSGIKKDPPITMSFGVSAHVRGQTADECVRIADAALYRAKGLGRNRVVVGGPPPPPAKT